MTLLYYDVTIGILLRKKICNNEIEYELSSNPGRVTPYHSTGIVLMYKNTIFGLIQDLESVVLGCHDFVRVISHWFFRKPHF
jgi:hypothetical protein